MSVTKKQQRVRKFFLSDKLNQAPVTVNRVVFLVPLFLLSVPSTCRVDVATALSQIGFLLLVLIVPIEALVFINYPKLKNKLSNSPKSFEKISGMEILTIVLVANLASSAAGSFFHIYKYRLENLITISIAFVLSILIEWLIYVTYFLIQRRKKALELLNICILANVVTYLIFFFPQASVNLLSSYDYDRFAQSSAFNVAGIVSDYYANPNNTDFNFDRAKLREYGYKDWEREAYWIKIKMEVEIKFLEDSSNPRIAIWHKKGRRVFLIDKNLDIVENLKTELNDDLKAELDLRE